MSKNKKKLVENSQKSTEVNNGLSDVVMGGVNPLYMGNQVSQTDTLFANNRNYLISNMRQLLSEIYVEHGMIANFVDLPVDDALRGGFDIKTKQLSEDEIIQLKAHMEDMNDLETIKDALKWMRLYGGAGIVAMTGQKHDQPLIREQKALQGLEFRAVDMWELFSAQQNIDDDTRQLKIESEKKDFCYGYYSINLHNSRVCVLKGKVAPAFVRPRLRGWGLSVVEAIVQSVNQFLKTKGLTFEVLDEFKLDIFKIDGFNNALLTKDGTEKIQRRVALANAQKNYNNALTMDIKDDHTSKQLNFTGIADIKKELRIELASDLKMPMTKLFGLSAAGFNSGEDDIEVYNGMIESETRSKAKKPCRELVKLRCIQLFGIEPSDLEIEFKPLRVLSHEQEEKVKDSKMQRIVNGLDKGIITIKEAQESANRDNLYSVKVEIGEKQSESDVNDLLSKKSENDTIA